MIRSSSLVLLLMIALALSACGGESSTTTPDVQADAVADVDITPDTPSDQSGETDASDSDSDTADSDIVDSDAADSDAPETDTVDPGPTATVTMGGLEFVSERIRTVLDGVIRMRPHIVGAFFLEPVVGYVSARYAFTSVFLSFVAEEGGCVVSTYAPGFCDACAWDQACSSDDVCVDWPTLASLGTITVTGIWPGDEVLEENANEHLYFRPPGAATLQDGDLDEGMEISVVAAGGDVEGFSASVNTVAELETGWADDFVLTLNDTEDAIVTWTAGSSGDRVRLVVTAANQCHGCPYTGVMVCEGPDTGSMTIPKGIIKEMPMIEPLEICVAQECPYAYLERFRSTTFPLGDGVAELRAADRVHFLVDHP
jgi:hypothetical protein